MIFRAQPPPIELVARSEPMRRIEAQMNAVVRARGAPILIEGEPGSGRTFMARIIHGQAFEPGAPFLVAACRPASMGAGIEETLFGREAGEGGDGHCLGLIDQARGGTLFLDEIGDLSLHLQARILDLVETGTFRRARDGRDRQAHVRIVAGTRYNLREAVAIGTFLGPLVERLAVFRLRIPPLRERRDDILPLASQFVRASAEREGKEICGLTADAEARLLRHDFPGNVRELRNLVARAVVLEQGKLVHAESLVFDESERPRSILAGWLAHSIAESSISRGRPPTLHELTREYLEIILAHARGNRSRVARMLGVSYPTVKKKIADFGIDVERYKP